MQIVAPRSASGRGPSRRSRARRRPAPAASRRPAAPCLRLHHVTQAVSARTSGPAPPTTAAARRRNVTARSSCGPGRGVALEVQAGDLFSQVGEHVGQPRPVVVDRHAALQQPPRGVGSRRFALQVLLEPVELASSPAAGRRAACPARRWCRTAGPGCGRRTCPRRRWRRLADHAGTRRQQHQLLALDLLQRLLLGGGRIALARLLGDVFCVSSSRASPRRPSSRRLCSSMRTFSGGAVSSVAASASFCSSSMLRKTASSSPCSTCWPVWTFSFSRMPG